MDELTLQRIRDESAMLTLARLQAVEAMLHALIATHPRPRALAESWAKGAPATMDRLMDGPLRSHRLEAEVADQMHYWGGLVDAALQARSASR